MAALFDPLRLRGVTLRNRICVSPMSQYRARDGMANDWHFAHLSRFALGGCAVVFTEATAVSKEARRTHGDLGIWCDEHIAPLERIAKFLKAEQSLAGVQLAHAGRKSSERRPWHGGTPVDNEDVRLRNEEPWQALGPTNEPYDSGWPAPTAMTEKDVRKVIEDFGRAARRADNAGFDLIEVYAAHGFLLHQFYSPLCNTRTDDWGGSFENRIRLSLEVASSIRENWPQEKPLFFRISATDWIDGGWDINDSVALAKALKSRGVDVIDCSSGGIGGPYPPAQFPLGRAFQSDLSETIRREADIASMAVGFIWEAETANSVVESGKAELVAIGRELLNNPNWALHAAAELSVDGGYSLWDPAFGWWLNKRDRLMKKLGLRNNVMPPKSAT
jgi:2,4-dienoyl-CoA reductase-like NADH-dependent reductase (Old Yellow Enzyme family)